MANSCDTVQSLRTGDGVTTQFSFTFTYDKESEVNVSLWDTTIEYYVPLANDQWSFVNATTVEFTTAPPALIDSEGNSIANVKIWRQTDVESLLASFYPGSAIRAQDLNSNFEQLRNAIQEGRCIIPQPIIDNLEQNYWNKNNETIKSADTWISDNNSVATTASIDNFVVDTINSKGYVIDAPNDGTQYGRQSGSWTEIPYSIPDAPADNRIYGRRDNSWSEVINVDSVNGKTGVVVLDADDVGAATSAQGATADSATQPGDNISTLTNDSGYITLAQVPSDAVSSVNTQTGAVVLDADDISDSTTTNKFATQTELNSIASATQPGDNVSTLTNDAGYLISVPVESVNGETGVVSIGIDNLNDVNVGTAVNGNVLSFNGNDWIPVSAPPADISGSSINQLKDVNAASATDGQIMVWDDTTNNWIPGDIGSETWVLNGSILQPVDDTYDVEIGGGIISLNADGSGEFASSKIILSGGGTIKGSYSDGNSYQTNGYALTPGDGGSGNKPRIELYYNSTAGFKADAGGNVEAAGNVLIGGTLPSSPNISLNADGSAVFTGNRVDFGSAASSNIRFCRPSDGLQTYVLGVDTRFDAPSDNNKFGITNSGGGAQINIGLVESGDSKLSVQTLSSGTSLFEEVASIKNDGSAVFTGAITALADATINGVTVGLGGGSVSTNTALGQSALQSNTTGSENIAVGLNAHNLNTIGSYNTVIGTNALQSNATGSGNVALGQRAGYYIEGSNNTILGAYPGTSADATLSDTVIISAGTTERMRIDSLGNVGIGTSSTSAKLDVQGDIRSRTTNPYFYLNNNSTQWGIRNNANQLTFEYQQTERLHVTTVGNVLIGGTLPSAPNIELNADGTSTYSSGQFNLATFRRTAAGGGAQITLENGNSGVRTFANDASGHLFFGYNSANQVAVTNSGDLQVGGTLTSSPNISLRANGVAQAKGGFIAKQDSGYFLTAQSTSNVNKLLIGSDGNVLIGGTLPSSPNITLSAGDGSVFTPTVGMLGSPAETDAALTVGHTWGETNEPCARFGYGAPDSFNQRAVINRDGSATFSGKLVSASTVSGDTGTTLATKDYVDSNAYPGIPQNAQTSAYTLVSTDNGKHISITTGGVTVPSGVFNVGDTISIYNNSAADQTITQGASVTLRFAGTVNVGNRTLAQRGLATVLCVGNNEFVISGGGLS